MKQNNLVECDLLKLDCEGAEYSIVYSMPTKYFKKIKYIVADVHKMDGTDENIDALANFLRENGYKVDTKNQELLYTELV